MYSRAGLSQDTPLYPPNMKLPTWIMVTVGPLSSQLPWNVDAAQPSSLACQHLTNLLRTELLITGSKNDLKFSKYLLSLPRIVDASKPPLKKKRHLWFLSLVLAPAALSGTQRSCTRIVMPKPDMRLSLGEVATIAAIDETTILELKTPSTLIRIFLNPQLYLRIWLPSTLIQWIICYSVTSQGRAQFVTVNIQDGAQRNVTHFFTFCTSVSSLMTCV